jgi:hypothetical protein
LSDNDLLVHIDFSENYACKYAKEIQSVHFGGNRTHITLHTGMIYSKTRKEAFCTITTNLHHDPVAVFTHLRPILEENSQVKNVHFLSDSPSSQYRNQGMFYVIIKKIVPIFLDLQTLTWNYSESGHGKGAPDGIGGTIKRTCDRVVACNKDVSNFQQFTECIQDQIEKIRVLPITAVCDTALEVEIKQCSIPIKGKQDELYLSLPNYQKQF